jgi:hypothetical protein
MRGVLLIVLASLASACAAHEIVRKEWPGLGNYKPNKSVLLEAKDGMVYVTPKTELTFVRKDGREITRFWQEIKLAKNTFTAISLDHEVFSFGLSDLDRIVAGGKLAGELTGVVTDRGPSTGGPGGPGGMGGGMRPMMP